MKLLAFVDLHGDLPLFKKLIQRAEEKDIDLVVIAGDLTMLESHLSYMLKKLNALKKKILLIPGNHESEKGLKAAASCYENCLDFHKKALKISNYIFLGYGEGGFSLEDAEFRKLARDWYGNYQKEKVIFVTHAPPFGTKLDRLANRYTGNKDFRSFIERLKPRLVICGHLHENAGKIDEINTSKLINPGWEGMVVELD